MSSFISLVKIGLLNLFDVHKIVNSSSKEERSKNIRKFLLLVVGLLFLSYYIYIFVDFSMPGFLQLEIPHVVLVQYFLVTSMFILSTNIFRIKGLLFDFRDYDLLMSLPIKKNVILASKFATLYVTNMIYVLLLMVPCLIGYIKYVSVSWLFYILYVLTLFIIPIIPIIIASFVGIVIINIVSYFKNKNVANYLVNFVFVIGIIYLSFKMDGMESLDMANLGNSMVNLFNNYYPLTKLYLLIVENLNLVAFFSFLLISLLVFFIFLIIINRYYLQIRSRLFKSVTKDNYEVKVYKVHSPIVSLYIKEIKRYFSSINYVMNTMFGCVILVISLFLLLILRDDKIETFLKISDIKNIVTLYGPIILGLFCSLSSTTHSAISLEGKNYWIMKTLPVSPYLIFASKIMVNLTILLPTILIASVLLLIYLKANLITFIFLVVTPLVYGLFTSILGLILNLNYPDFYFESEVKVIKQSVPSFLTVIIGLLVGIIPLTKLSSLSILSVTLMILIVDCLLIYYLYKFGPRKFDKLS